MTGARALTVHACDLPAEAALDTNPELPRLDGLSRWLAGVEYTWGSRGPAANLRRWTALGLWTHPEAAVASLDRVDAHMPWMRSGTQWHMAALATRSVGVCDHNPDSTVGPVWETSPTTLDGPVLSVTTAGYTAFGAPDVARLARFSKANIHLSEEVVGRAKGFRVYRAVAPLQFGAFDGCNVTYWDDLASLNDYAYRQGAEHRGDVDDHRSTASGWFDRSSFTRFQPLREEGTRPAWP